MSPIFRSRNRKKDGKRYAYPITGSHGVAYREAPMKVRRVDSQVHLISDEEAKRRLAKADEIIRKSKIPSPVEVDEIIREEEEE